jgi:type I restriction enzyme M protein
LAIITERPPVSGKLMLADRFDELHELLYRRGGVRPVNAAIDEVCKLLLLRIHLARAPEFRASGRALSELLDPAFIRRSPGEALAGLRNAFDVVNALPDYSWRTHGGGGGFFIEGESLRLTEPEVLAEAAAIVRSIPVLPNGSRSASERLQEEDAAGLAFEVFLRGRYENAGGLGTYLTPDAVVEAMTAMALRSVPSTRLWADDLLIGDPCCGTGRFLVAAMRHVEARMEAEGIGSSELAERVERVRRVSLYGADQAESSLLKARLNFLMYGVLQPRLERVTDSLIDPSLDQLIGKFDLVLTNPPFGGAKYDRPEGLKAMRREDRGLLTGWTWSGDERSTRRAVSRADPALLFWDFDLSLLRPGGVLAIVLPDGLLGPRLKWAHDYLVRGGQGRPSKAELLAVVSLPRQTFGLAGTAAKTSFLILRRPEEPRSAEKRVFVAVSEHVGYLQRGPRVLHDPDGNDLPGIAQAYGDPSSAGFLSDPFTMSLSRSLEAYADGSAGSALESSIGSVARISRRRRRGGGAYFLSVLHVGSNCLVDWPAAMEYHPKTPGKACEPGDVLVSCINPQIPRITVIPEDAGDGECSSEFAVLRPSGIDPFELALLLRSPNLQEQLAARARGTSSSRRRVDDREILDLPMPDPAQRPAPGDVAAFREALASDREARNTVSRVLSRLRAGCADGQPD